MTKSKFDEFDPSRLPITRRDFVNATLAGAGVAALTQCAPAQVRPTNIGELDKSWTGPGGVGDYASANGNTARDVNHAHAALRDFSLNPRAAVSDETEYDIIVIGSGFAGLAAAHELKKRHGNSQKCLILESHAIFGGNAKENEIRIDGQRLLGPQASNDIFVPGPEHGFVYDYWNELRLPLQFDFAEPKGFDGTKIKVSPDNYMPMYWDETSASVGWFFDTEGTGEWVVDPFTDQLQRAPLSSAHKQEWLDFRFANNGNDLFQTYGKSAGFETEDAWLDSMSYGQFIENIMGLGGHAKQLADPLIAVGDMGASSDAVSALAAKMLFLPGVVTSDNHMPFEGQEVFSFPGGNSVVVRHFVKSLIPGAYGDGFNEIAGGQLNFQALDQKGSAFRMRLGALATSVQQTSNDVEVVYFKDGMHHSVRSKAVIMATEGHVAKRVVKDLPQTLEDAFWSFNHGPILTVNVALRHWRFLADIEISAARWMQGFGFYGNVRQPMHFGDITPPYDPDQPIVWTFYVPFTYPISDAAAHGAMARNEMYNKSFLDYEIEVRRQLQKMFGAHGFDHERDIAGIILNRWGHAYVSPQPGFFTGIEGAPPPSSVIRDGFDRIQFAHSELSGRQNWIAAVVEGKRAMQAAMERIGS